MDNGNDRNFGTSIKGNDMSISCVFDRICGCCNIGIVKGSLSVIITV